MQFNRMISIQIILCKYNLNKGGEYTLNLPKDKHNFVEIQTQNMY